jgi:hypothetical protein
MIDNIHNNEITQAMGRNALPRTDAANRPAGDGSDATLQADFADLIHQALQASETETDAVRRARALLESGQLTSPENIRSAAENIVTLGI